jgi:hypothetical protein
MRGTIHRQETGLEIQYRDKGMNQRYKTETTDCIRGTIYRQETASEVGDRYKRLESEVHDTGKSLDQRYNKYTRD